MITFKEYLEESRMGEIHMDVSDHLDKHIKAYKAKKMDADTLGQHCVACHKKIAKMHNIPIEGARSLVNGYVDSELS